MTNIHYLTPAMFLLLGIRSKHPIVIIFQDFEMCNPSVLQDVFNGLLSAQGLSSKTQFYVVLGMSSSTDAVHELLPDSITSRLIFRKFQFVSVSRAYVDKFIFFWSYTIV